MVDEEAKRRVTKPLSGECWSRPPRESGLSSGASGKLREAFSARQPDGGGRSILSSFVAWLLESHRFIGAEVASGRWSGARVR